MQSSSPFPHFLSQNVLKVSKNRTFHQIWFHFYRLNIWSPQESSHNSSSQYLTASLALSRAAEYLLWSYFYQLLHTHFFFQCQMHWLSYRWKNWYHVTIKFTGNIQAYIKALNTSASGTHTLMFDHVHFCSFLWSTNLDVFRREHCG